jgi:hypothetical protein
MKRNPRTYKEVYRRQLNLRTCASLISMYVSVSI